MRVTIDTKWLESFSYFDVETRIYLYESMFAYLQGEEVDTDKPGGVLFKMIKPSLDDELSRMSRITKRNKENGKKGGRPKTNPIKPKKPKKPNGFMEERTENLKKLDEWMKLHTPYISEHIKPMNNKEFESICSKYSSREICDTLEQIENRKDLRKTYTNLYRTLLNWLKNGYNRDND